jgi:hypothetical protein
MAIMPSDEDVAKLAVQCEQLLGPADSWTPPEGYPDGLGLCIIDAVWSMGVRYGGSDASSGGIAPFAPRKEANRTSMAPAT